MIKINEKEISLDKLKRAYQYRSDADAHTICLLIDRVRELEQEVENCDPDKIQAYLCERTKKFGW